MPLSGSLPLSLAWASTLTAILVKWPTHILLLCLFLTAACFSVPALRTLSLGPATTTLTRYHAFEAQTPTLLQFRLPYYKEYYLGVARIVIVESNTFGHDDSPPMSRAYYLGLLGQWWAWRSSGQKRTEASPSSKNGSPSASPSCDATALEAHKALGQLKRQATQRKQALRTQLRHLQETQRLQWSRRQKLEREAASMRERLEQLNTARATRGSLTFAEQVNTWECQAAERTKTYLERRAHLLQRISSAQSCASEWQHQASALQARVDALRFQLQSHARLSTPPPVLPPLEPDADTLCHLLPSNLLSWDDTFDTPSISSDSQNSPPTPNGSAVFPSGPGLPSLNPRAKEFTSARTIRSDASDSESMASPRTLYP